jgi:hypothetical protein
MDVYAYLLYSDKSEIDKVSTLEKLANDMHQVSVSIPETWTVIGYYSLKKKHQKAKCFAENVTKISSFWALFISCTHLTGEQRRCLLTMRMPRPFCSEPFR